MMSCPKCPRKCSRLTSAAIFLSAGIVQLIAGLILLKTDYINLLAAPDFWTSISNISVGCLIGVTASVWKNKSCSKDIRRARKYLVGAIFISSLVINASTSAIVILGEGNALLSLRMVEKSQGKLLATLASEILAYAYAASVICPIICMVVSVITLLATCFPDGTSSISKTSKRRYRKKPENFETYNWVYTPEIGKFTKSLDRRQTPNKKSPSGISSRSSITLSSSFSGFASGLDTPSRTQVATSLDRASLNGRNVSKDLDTIPISPNDTDTSFEDTDSSPTVGEIVPICLGMKRTKRQPSGILVKVPVAPDVHQNYRSWRNEVLPPSRTVDVSEVDPSTRPKARMVFSGNSYEDEKPNSPLEDNLEIQDDYEKSWRLLKKEYRKVDSRRINSKKPDFRRLNLMESINECPVDCLDDESQRRSPTDSSGYGSSLDRTASHSSQHCERIASKRMDVVQSLHGHHDDVEHDERSIQERLNAYVEG